ncbi:MAG: carbohydrate ABC transporter permease, partial [Clostridia bacterium]
EYTLAMVLVTDPAKKTLPVGLTALNQVMEYSTDWVALFAALMIAFLPTLLIYASCKSQLLQGVNLGGIKG